MNTAQLISRSGTIKFYYIVLHCSASETTKGEQAIYSICDSTASRQRKKGSIITAQREDSSSVTRNASMFRRVELPPEPPDDVPTADNASSDTVISDGETHVGRPQHVRQKVKRLIDEM